MPVSRIGLRLEVAKGLHVWLLFHEDPCEQRDALEVTAKSHQLQDYPG